MAHREEVMDKIFTINICRTIRRKDKIPKMKQLNIKLCEICKEEETVEIVRLDGGERWKVCEDCGERLREI